MATAPKKAEPTAAEIEAKAEAEARDKERSLDKEEKTLMQVLQEMPKALLTIPEDPNNPDDVVPIGWNGIIYAVPRGIEFEVPVVIKEIWQESYAKTQAVHRRIRESVNKEIKIM
jgi:hypothetical protein